MSERKLPLDGIYAYHRIKDNTIHLAADSGPLKGWDFPLPRLSNFSKNIRFTMEDEGVLNKTLDSLVRSFVASGTKTATYATGLVIERDERIYSNASDNYVSLFEVKKSESRIKVGIDFSGIGVFCINGAEASGKTTFAKTVFPSDLTMVLDFAKIEHDGLTTMEKKKYGTGFARQFIRHTEKKFLVIDHYYPSTAMKSLKYHPAFYYDTLNQILEYLNYFREESKTIVLTGVEKANLSGLEPDSSVELLGHNVYTNYGFTLGGVDFPAVKK